MSGDIGESVRRSIQITNSAGAAVDADSLPIWNVTLPDGTSGTPPTVQHGGTGQYWVDFTTTQVGRHEDRWSATVGGLTVRFGPDAFNIRASSVGPIVGLSDARQWLGIASPAAARDEVIRDLLDRATEIAEGYTGRTYRVQTFTDVFDGGGTKLRLRHTPVQSVTSITEFSSPVTLFVLDQVAGLVSRGTKYGGYYWLPGVQNITIVYVAGTPVVPQRVQMAVLELARHLYEPQRGGVNLPRQQGGDVVPGPGPGFSIPNRVRELLDLDRAAGF